MGHYYAEMMCGKCGALICRCPPKKEDSREGRWMVSDDWEVVEASSWIAAGAWGQERQRREMKALVGGTFAERSEALAEAKGKLLAALRRSMGEVERLAEAMERLGACEAGPPAAGKAGKAKRAKPKEPKAAKGA